MPRIRSKNKYLKYLRGLHLWHADMSSCSQRVRIALSEKGLIYTSHLINLQAGENASAAYQSIHPQGLVPAMVIDGELFVESIDIIDEINRQEEEPFLIPKDTRAASEMDVLMKRADEAQPALKLLTFEFLFNAAPPPPKDVFDAFQKNHKNEYLKTFFRDFAKGFSRDRVTEAVRKSQGDFMFLETILSDGRPYLAGGQFSLADIAWMPNFRRFALFGWPFEKYPGLHSWFERVKTRPSHKQGLLDWEPKPFLHLVGPKIAARELAGDGVASYILNTQ